MKRIYNIAVGIGLAWLSVCSAQVQAAELKILSSNGVTAMLQEIGTQYEHTTGNKLVIRFDTANLLKSQIDGGEPFDVVILTKPLTAELLKQGKVAQGSTADIARSGIGVAVRKGAPKPDIGTVDAFKRTMLAAKSVAFTATGSSGMYFDGLLKRLGIADAMKAKAKRPQGGAVAELVARGEAELAVQQISELLVVPGADYVGPLPPELQNFTVFSAGIAADSKNAPAAKALIQALTAPSALPVIKAKGMEAP